MVCGAVLGGLHPVSLVFSCLFWKELCNAIEGKVESWSRIKDGNGRSAQGRITC